MNILILKQEVLFLINFLAPPDYCLNSPCQNNGICQSLTDTYSCNCPETHTGRNCQESKEWMMHLSISVCVCFGRYNILLHLMNPANHSLALGVHLD